MGRRRPCSRRANSAETSMSSSVARQPRTFVLTASLAVHAARATRAATLRCPRSGPRAAGSMMPSEWLSWPRRTRSKSGRRSAPTQRGGLPESKRCTLGLSGQAPASAKPPRRHVPRRGGGTRPETSTAGLDQAPAAITWRSAALAFSYMKRPVFGDQGRLYSAWATLGLRAPPRDRPIRSQMNLRGARGARDGRSRACRSGCLSWW